MEALPVTAKLEPVTVVNAPLVVKVPEPLDPSAKVRLTLNI